jgi:hypothetical protein
MTLTPAPAPTRDQYLRILAGRILQGQPICSTIPASEIAEAEAIARASGLKKPRPPRSAVVVPEAGIVGHVVDCGKKP